MYLEFAFLGLGNTNLLIIGVRCIPSNHVYCHPMRFVFCFTAKNNGEFCRHLFYLYQ